MIKRSTNQHSRRGIVATEAAVVHAVFDHLDVRHVGSGSPDPGESDRRQLRARGRPAGRRRYVNGTPVTSAMVQQAVRDYMRASGLPAAAYNGATITLTCLASPNWVNPSDALPLDRFTVQVTIPTGAAFNSMLWSLVTRLTSVNQMSVTVAWVSCTDAKIAVSTQLPYYSHRMRTCQEPPTSRTTTPGRLGGRGRAGVADGRHVPVRHYGIWPLRDDVADDDQRGPRRSALRPDAHSAGDDRGTTYGNATSDVTNIINKALVGQSLSGQNVQIYAADSLGNNTGSWTSTQVGQSVCVRITGNYRMLLASMFYLPATYPGRRPMCHAQREQLATSKRARKQVDGPMRSIRRTNRSKRQSGVVLVLVLVTLITLMTFVALAVDLGMLAVARTQCQDAADSAAMAGARALNGNSSNNNNYANATPAALQAATGNVVLSSPIQSSQVAIDIGRYVYVPANLRFEGQFPGPSTENWSMARATISTNIGTQLPFARVFSFAGVNLQAVATAAHRPRDIAIVLDYSGSMRVCQPDGHADLGQSLVEQSGQRVSDVRPLFGHQHSGPASDVVHLAQRPGQHHDHDQRRPRPDHRGFLYRRGRHAGLLSGLERLRHDAWRRQLLEAEQQHERHVLPRPPARF